MNNVDPESQNLLTGERKDNEKQYKLMEMQKQEKFIQRSYWMYLLLFLCSGLAMSIAIFSRNVQGCYFGRNSHGPLQLKIVSSDLVNIMIKTQFVTYYFHVKMILLCPCLFFETIFLRVLKPICKSLSKIN
jgi:hypothetical protein